ncbi:MAG: aldo/keto reductase [Aestuariibacter sp.]|uniref:aldo/keto reductase n=1 Tax=Marisediminitalea aggregata TaxID=634436 RepID=UPI0020CE17CD|nr:aldo/keto reductase [Marisediminitalea aggregata]MCP3861684.1 aldo/keto reductase [Aestuariibacter sp.]MCP4529232.1 aldo/keto reductase [Aestuariibacter sp.]MCP4949650.1 aldo/keto reductase [Aestuariibacter sp.]MCP9478067.1 aldo/keto reductase [Marisediminitalea aggregata]
MGNTLVTTRQLGRTGMAVSEVGLGCWQLGGDFGPVSAATAEAVIEQAVKEGINFFDTADVYGDGISEQYLGKLVNQLMPEAVIATKYGRAAGTYPDGYSLTDLRDSVRRAQDRLQRDSLDLLQLHCVPERVLAEQHIFDWLREVQQEGLIKAFGASVETHKEAEICLEHSDLQSLQIIFNLLRQRPIEALFDKALAQQVGIIVRLPLASGMLSGKFSKDTAFAETDHRNYNKDGEAFSVGETFSGIAFDKGLEIVDTLKQSVPEGMTMAQFAMRWILDHEAVTTIIPGASSASQVTQNARVSQLPVVDQAVHETLFAYYESDIEKYIRCPL